MLRKMILGAAAAVAIGFGGQAASAHDPGRGPLGPGGGGGYFPPSGPVVRYDHDYVVYVRHGNHWDRVGRFETRREAERAACRLEDRGYRVRVEVIEDRCRRW
jgi:arylamine N-acetyltransferase